MVPGAVTPRIYVYDVANFTDTPPSRELAFGKHLGGSLYDTPTQYGMGRLLHWRLLHSRYRVMRPSEANIFFLPAMTAPHNKHDIERKCTNHSSILSDEAAVRARLHALDSSTACGHIFLIGKAFHESRSCRWWSEPRDPLLRNVTRLAYTHPLPGYDGGPGSAPDDWVRKYVTEPRRLGKTYYPNLFSIPYPSSIHWSPSAERSGAVPPWSLNHRRGARPWLMLFLGQFGHGDEAVRSELRKLCVRRHPTLCQVQRYDPRKAGSEVLNHMRNATFCLQPGGDTPARKSLVDAITLGCIPVLFSRMQDEFMPWWSWHSWRDRGRVLVNRSDFLRGKINLPEYLSEIAADPVRIGEMQATLERHARSMQVSTEDDPDDALSVILSRVLRRCHPSHGAPSSH